MYYTYIQYIGPYRYIGKGKGNRYLDIHKDSSKHYQNAVKKYGLTYSIIYEYHDSEVIALQEEIKLISLLKSLDDNLLNKMPGGNNPPKCKVGQGKGRAAWNKGKKGEYKIKNRKPRKQTKETKDKISKKLSGIKRGPRTPEHNKNQSLAQKGKPWSAKRRAAQSKT
jgi:hypothetical protein